MEDWLTRTFFAEGKLELPVVTGRLVVAGVLGSVVAVIHRVTTHRASEPPETLSISTTLVLLAILIATVTQVIGNSVARAFSLVGALAIVRFRTVVEDMRDTAFVIFAVVVGMAAGAGYLTIALTGLVVGGAAAFALKMVELMPPLLPHRPPEGGAAASEYTLTVRVGLKQGQQQLFDPLFEQYLEKAVLVSTGTTRQGAALEMTWRVRLRPSVDAVAFVAGLNQVEGVQGVELQRR